jgi:signal transduction histidine kinase
MQQAEQAAGWNGAERKRIEAIVETLAGSPAGGETLAEVAHDARNMVTALLLYCDLLQVPGVLATSYLHYGNELRLVAAASRRLVEKLGALDAGRSPEAGSPAFRRGDAEMRGTKFETGDRPRRTRRLDPMPAVLIDNLAVDLLANRTLLAALAGPLIALTVTTEAGARPVWLTGEDLTRVLVNLVKNAAEAMPGGGKIRLDLQEQAAEGSTGSLYMTVDDSGPGIPAEALERVFEAGFSSQSNSSAEAGWPAFHRGLGLSITRSLIEKAGGSIVATNRSPASQSSTTQPPTGARLAIELPIRAR